MWESYRNFEARRATSSLPPEDGSKLLNLCSDASKASAKPILMLQLIGAWMMQDATALDFTLSLQRSERVYAIGSEELL